jgi:hypothetical protein
VKARLNATDDRYKERFVYHAMKLCGIHEANESGSQAALDAERCEVLRAICGKLEDSAGMTRPDKEFPKLIKNITKRLADAKEQGDKRSEKVLIKIWEIRCIHYIFKSLPIILMINIINLPREVIQKYAVPSPGQRFQLSNVRHQKVSEGPLRKTLERLLQNGDGGRLSMASTVLLLERLVTCIKEDVALPMASMPLIAPILWKLQGYGIDSAFIFDQKEMQTLLDIYDSTTRMYEADTEPLNTPQPKSIPI